MTQILSGSTNQVLHFVAVDATDKVTREPGLSGFTVVRSRNGGTPAAMTTPTITELNGSTMPGVYALLLDEDTTLDAGFDCQEMVLHITHGSIAPVTREVTIVRPKYVAGSTMPTITGDAYARLGAPAGASVSADIAAVAARTTNLPTDPADQSLIIAATDAVMARLGAPAGASIAADIAGISGGGGGGLDAAGVRAAIGLAAANLDTQLSSISALATAVKGKTDSLTFTMAGHVDANIQRINDVTITGNGQTGTEFDV